MKCEQNTINLKMCIMEPWGKNKNNSIVIVLRWLGLKYYETYTDINKQEMYCLPYQLLAKTFYT